MELLAAIRISVIRRSSPAVRQFSSSSDGKRSSCCAGVFTVHSLSTQKRFVHTSALLRAPPPLRNFETVSAKGHRIAAAGEGAGSISMSAPTSIYERVADLTQEAAFFNKDPILDLIWKPLVLPQFTAPIRVLELAAGSGQQAAFFTQQLGDAIERYQPTEYDGAMVNAMRTTIPAMLRDMPADVQAKVSEPLELNVSVPGHWAQLREKAAHSAGFHVVFAVNVTHIAPWQTTEDMLRGAAQQLIPGNGIFFLYGPFKQHGEFTTESNRRFDAWLRTAKNPSYGLRDIAEVQAAAAKVGLMLRDVVAMPENNFTLVFARAP